MASDGWPFPHFNTANSLIQFKSTGQAIALSYSAIGQRWWVGWVVGSVSPIRAATRRLATSHPFQPHAGCPSSFHRHRQHPTTADLLWKILQARDCVFIDSRRRLGVDENCTRTKHTSTSCSGGGWLALDWRVLKWSTRVSWELWRAVTGGTVFDISSGDILSHPHPWRSAAVWRTAKLSFSSSFVRLWLLAGCDVPVVVEMFLTRGKLWKLSCSYFR